MWFLAIHRSPRHRIAWLFTLIATLVSSYEALGSLPPESVWVVSAMLLLWCILTFHTLVMVHRVTVRSAKFIDASSIWSLGAAAPRHKDDAFEVAQVISIKQLERGIARSRKYTAWRNASKESYEREVHEAAGLEVEDDGTLSPSPQEPKAWPDDGWSDTHRGTPVPKTIRFLTGNKQPWYTVPNHVMSAKGQKSWRDAVLEVAEVAGDRDHIRFYRDRLPGSELFLCRECECEPTYEVVCSLCRSGL